MLIIIHGSACEDNAQHCQCPLDTNSRACSFVISQLNAHGGVEDLNAASSALRACQVVSYSHLLAETPEQQAHGGNFSDSWHLCGIC